MIDEHVRKGVSLQHVHDKVNDKRLLSPTFSNQTWVPATAFLICDDTFDLSDGGAEFIERLEDLDLIDQSTAPSPSM